MKLDQKQEQRVDNSIAAFQKPSVFEMYKLMEKAFSNKDGTFQTRNYIIKCFSVIIDQLTNQHPKKVGGRPQSAPQDIQIDTDAAKEIWLQSKEDCKEKNPNLRKTIQISLNPFYWTYYNRLAKHYGISKKELLLSCLFSQTRRLHQINILNKFLIDLNTQLQRLGKNYWQSMRYLHKQSISPELQSGLQESLNQIRPVVAKVEKVLSDVDIKRSGR